MMVRLSKGVLFTVLAGLVLVDIGLFFAWRRARPPSIWRLENHTPLKLALSLPVAIGYELPVRPTRIRVVVRPQPEGLHIVLNGKGGRLAALKSSWDDTALVLEIYGTGNRPSKVIAHLNHALITALAYAQFPGQPKKQQRYIRETARIIRKHPIIIAL